MPQGLLTQAEWDHARQSINEVYNRVGVLSHLGLAVLFVLMTLLILTAISAYFLLGFIGVLALIVMASKEYKLINEQADRVVNLLNRELFGGGLLFIFGARKQFTAAVACEVSINLDMLSRYISSRVSWLVCVFRTLHY